MRQPEVASSPNGQYKPAPTWRISIIHLANAVSQPTTRKYNGKSAANRPRTPNTKHTRMISPIHLSHMNSVNRSPPKPETRTHENPRPAIKKEVDGRTKLTNRSLDYCPNGPSTRIHPDQPKDTMIYSLFHCCFIFASRTRPQPSVLISTFRCSDRANDHVLRRRCINSIAR